jgi:Zierdtviridae DNA polymerase
MVTRRYAELHAHTTFSPGDGFMMPKDHMEACAELGIEARAFTEHGNVSSHVKAEIASAVTGVKAIFGCELYCDTGSEKGQTKHHLTLLAANQQGLRNLYAVVSRSWVDFHYKPTTFGDTLAEYAEGLIVLSGCLGGRLAQAVMGGKGEADKVRADVASGVRVAQQFRDIFLDRYYLEVQGHPLLERQKAYNQALARISDRTGIPLVVTGDVHYPTEADHNIYPLLHAIDRGGGRNTVEAQAQSWEYGIVLAHQDPRVVFDNLVATGLSPKASEAAMDRTIEVSSRCNVVLPKLKDLIFPGTRRDLEW